MDYLTLLREVSTEQKRDREAAACEMRKLISELCQVAQKIELVLSRPQIAILIARQETLIEADERDDSTEKERIGLLYQQYASSNTHVDFDASLPLISARDEFDELSM